MYTKKYLRYIAYISIVLLLNGCFASKAPLDSVSSQRSLEGKTLVIGTLSRPIEYTGYKTMGFKLFNKKTGKEELISVTASTDMNNYTKFENDYIYSDRKGSIFAKVVPSGEYILANYSARYPYGYGGFISDYSRKITLNDKDIVYIGDMSVLPGNVGGARDCIISDKFERDFNLFKKQYNFSYFKRENIKTDVLSITFKINLHDQEKEFNQLMQDTRIGLGFALLPVF